MQNLLLLSLQQVASRVLSFHTKWTPQNFLKVCNNKQPNWSRLHFNGSSPNQDDFIMMRKQEKKLYIFFSARIFQTAWLFLENSKMSGLCLLLLWISNIVLLCKLHFRQPAKIKSFHRQVAFYFVAWIMPNLDYDLNSFRIFWLLIFGFFTVNWTLLQNLFSWFHILN